jgi:hypothetical protein
MRGGDHLSHVTAAVDRGAVTKTATANPVLTVTVGSGVSGVSRPRLFDEQDPAVRWMIESVISAAHKAAPKSDCAVKRPAITQNLRNS